MPALSIDHALVLMGARQVHTFGLRYAIDVAFCDGSWKIVHLVRALRPRRITRWVRAAHAAIEVPAGTLDGIEVGEQLRLVEAAVSLIEVDERVPGPRVACSHLSDDDVMVPALDHLMDVAFDPRDRIV